MDVANMTARFGAYVKRLAVAVAHQDRVEPLVAYISGLTLPGERKSRSAAAVEPIAARIEPQRVSARHQSLLHFVGKAAWDDQAVLLVARDYALSQLLTHGPVRHLLIDDTGFPPAG